MTKANYAIFVQYFRQMVAADLQWFISALSLCTNVKAAIMAGSVTNDRRDYLDKFLQVNLPSSHSLKPRQLLGGKAPGATAVYDLVGPNISIPVFFVSASPSGDNGVKLVTEVQRNLSVFKKAGF